MRRYSIAFQRPAREAGVLNDEMFGADRHDEAVKKLALARRMATRTCRYWIVDNKA